MGVMNLLVFVLVVGYIVVEFNIDSFTLGHVVVIWKE